MFSPNNTFSHNIIEVFYAITVLQIFEKALEEPKYSSLYAQLCRRLCEDAPNFEPPNSKTSVSYMDMETELYHVFQRIHNLLNTHTIQFYGT